jgi:hypothetical protein
VAGGSGWSPEAAQSCHTSSVNGFSWPDFSDSAIEQLQPIEGT